MVADIVARIENYLEISERLGTGGQPRPEAFAALAAAGYEVVINLAMPNTPEAALEEDWLVTQAGMVYVHLPVVWEAPDPAAVDHFCDLMDFYRERKIFVHCIKNMRVSAFLYIYRVCRQHVVRAEAARDLYCIWRPYGVWQQLIDAALGACNGQRECESL
jgi:protein tyrosine phosphatase (PTP) superfamily phosphohydrolase (DUF442 family)